MNTKSLGFTLTLAIAVMLLGYVNPSVAAKDKGCPESGHPSCGNGGGETGDVVTYDVELTGAVVGTNIGEDVGKEFADWIDQQAGSIGNSFSPGVDAGTLNLAAFSGIFDTAVLEGDAVGSGDGCFSAPNITVRDGGVTKSKRNQIEVGLWIDGRTFDDADDGTTSDDEDAVVYTFWIRGPRPDIWLPEDGMQVHSELESWKIEPANHQPELVPRSCTGEGNFDPNSQQLYVTGRDSASN